MIFRRAQFVLCVLLAGFAGLAACGMPEGAGPVEVRPVFPDAAPLAHRHRNHSMTESPDGRLRVFAAQQGDETELMAMRRVGETWSAPVLLDLPRRETNTSPRFFPDGTLYYASDAPHPDRPGRKDLNIWRVDLHADNAGVDVGVPDVLPDVINSGSHEDGFAPLGSGRAVFSSTTLGGAGGYDLYIAERAAEGWQVHPFAHNTEMADSHPVAVRNGEMLIWYAHLPSEVVYGAVDLFVSRRNGAGWSPPENLGPLINAAGIEYGPGVSGDGDTLFFSRDGILLEVDLAGALSRTGYVAPE